MWLSFPSSRPLSGRCFSGILSPRTKTVKSTVILADVFFLFHCPGFQGPSCPLLDLLLAVASYGVVILQSIQRLLVSILFSLLEVVQGHRKHCNMLFTVVQERWKYHKCFLKLRLCFVKLWPPVAGSGKGAVIFLDAASGR